MAKIVGLACFSILGLILLISGVLFVFARDLIWRRGRSIDSMIPKDYQRNPQWDSQMIAVGIVLLVLGALCVGLSAIGWVFG